MPFPANRLLLTLLLFTLFFFSGALALVYEVSWVRALTLEFGSTTLAVSTVLTVFMGGLALGAHLGGRRADRISSPLTVYGFIELCVGTYALATPFLFSAVLPLFGWAAAGISTSLWFLSLVRFVVSALLLLLPTALMGATLPILTRFYVLHKRDGGRGAGLLYGVNTVGAFAGTLAVGLLLLPGFGLRWTILLAGIGNLILGFSAFLVGRRVERSEGFAPAAAVGDTEVDSAPADSVLPAVALTGFAAMVCEVAWTRLMALVLGASIHAFTVVLSTFLAGLGIGAAGVAAILRSAPSRARKAFTGMAICAAAMVGLSSAGLPVLPELFRQLYWSWNLGGDPGKVILLQFVLAGLVMLIPVLFMGGLFPAAARAVVRDPKVTGKRVGALYAWNTLGAIAGSFAAGFALIPLLGVRDSLVLAMVAQCAAGVIVMDRSAGRRVLASVSGLAACVVLAALLFVPPWHGQLMTSAMYHYAGGYSVEEAPVLKSALERSEELLFYRDGLTATVTVTRDLESLKGDLYISTNGKLDGSSHYDMPTQRLSAHIPLLIHPHPEEVCVIGIGTGCTAGSGALHAPVERLTLVEIEAAMVEGARLFRAHNSAVHDNRKVRIVVTDGRLFLKLNPRVFDVVISEPSNPWLAGTTDLFTAEFFRLGARSLREGGIFCQWVQLYGMRPDNVKIIVRTFAEVFPHVYLFSTIPDTDILLLGSESPLAPDLQEITRRMQQREVAQDLADSRVGIRDAFALAARFRMGPAEVRELAGGGLLHTDDLPIIAYRAHKDLYCDTREENMALLNRHSGGIVPYLRGLPGQPALRRETLDRLASAYQAFLPGGREAEASRSWHLSAEEESDR